MIRLICLSEPYVGVELEGPPLEILQSLVVCGLDWRVDYAEAAEEEISLWFPKELAARIFFTLKRGLPVSFQNRQYRCESEEAFSETLESLQEAIRKNPDKKINIISDDERGLVIGAE